MALNVLAEEYEMLDPTPDIYYLFQEYDRLFFGEALGSCELKWSKRMTSCAGLCVYEGQRWGGIGFCSIRLSEPLLKLRPRSDLINTLLHEMIHAYIFLTSIIRDHDDHGVIFQTHMHRINQKGNANITVYHTFHDEVENYRQHWWQCNGTCRLQSPYYGLVKRAMNRPPGANDYWWANHQRDCGGKYTKIREPKPKPKPKEKAQSLKKRKTKIDMKEQHKSKNTGPIDQFLINNPKKTPIPKQLTTLHGEDESLPATSQPSPSFILRLMPQKSKPQWNEVIDISLSP